MNRRGFTLLELLVVIAIMGLLGTVTVNGYRSMRRGMEERSVIRNVNQFIRSAYQRAQIDRMPVDVYFWNETLQEETSTTVPIVVGCAVAVRRSGRITRKVGNYLYDEFGDLRFNNYMTEEDEDNIESQTGSQQQSEGVPLYRMSGGDGNRIMRSTVAEMTVRFSRAEPLVLGGEGNAQGNIESWAFELLPGKDGENVQWNPGDAYGFEFSDLQLPHGYIFGSTWSKSVRSPVSGETVLRFNVSANSGNGAMSGTTSRDTIAISVLRPGKSGSLEAMNLATSQSPTQTLSSKD